MTSLAFMFVDVPAPPWTMSTTKCVCHLLLTISSQAREMTRDRTLTTRSASARISSRTASRETVRTTASPTARAEVACGYSSIRVPAGYDSTRVFATSRARAS